MTNRIKAADSLTFLTQVDVANRELVSVGDLFGIANHAAKAGTKVSVMREGLFQMPKLQGQSFAVGDPVYFDKVARAYTSVSAGNTWVGGAIEAAAAGDVEVRFLLQQQGGRSVNSFTNPVTGRISLSAGGVAISWDSIYQSAVPIVAPLDTSNNVVLSVNIPGNSMGPNGRLQIRMLWSYLNNANTKSIKIRFGGTAYAYNAGLASLAGANVVVDILNRGMTNSQIMTPISVNSTLTGMTQPFGVSSIDTTVDQLLTFECQKAVGTDGMVLEAAFVEVCK